MKTCIITGGNAGIGKAAAIQLARNGLHVIIGCRDEGRGLAALAEIKEKSKNDKVELVIVDMSLQSSIHRAAKEVRDKHLGLDIIIHNAADFDISRKSPVYTEEKIEKVWATNHIGPVLLTELLLPELKQREQGRVITIASQGLVLHPFLKINLEDPEFKKSRYSVEKAYYHSKLAQVMYTYWLAEQCKPTNITVNCIRVTNVKVDLQRYPNLSAFMKFMYSIKSRFAISPEKMAETYTYVATSPSIATVTGHFFNEKNQMVSSSRYSKNRRNSNALMELTRNYFLQ